MSLQRHCLYRHLTLDASSNLRQDALRFSIPGKGAKSGFSVREIPHSLTKVIICKIYLVQSITLLPIF